MNQYQKSLVTEDGLEKIKSVVRSVTKVIFITVLPFCLMLGLSACGGGKTSEKSENQISEDIQAKDIYFSNYDLKVDSISISKRQTNQEDKTDFVWCTVTASNNTFSYSAEYELTYVLYNDGWLLEEYMQDSSSVVPKSLPTQTQDEAMALVIEPWENGNMSNVYKYRVSQKSSLQKVSDLTYAYYFRIAWTSRHGQDGVPYDYAVYYNFDLASGQWNTEVESVDLKWN